MVNDDQSSYKFDGKAIMLALDALLSQLPDDPMEASTGLSQRKRSQMHEAAGELLRKLEAFHVALDPISRPGLVLDPSDPQVVGQLIAQTLLAQPRMSMSTLTNFYGSGVYAIYYCGDFDAYKPVSGRNTPLYVGKVDPQKPEAKTVEQQGCKLYGRLAGDHAKNIRLAENLDLEDFDCRYLVVKSAWQTTAETYLISRLKPIWNREVGICFGIGKHGDSPSKRANTRSPWDTLHPGRAWAWKKNNTPNPLSPEDIKALIAQHYRENPPENLGDE